MLRCHFISLIVDLYMAPKMYAHYVCSGKKHPQYKLPYFSVLTQIAIHEVWIEGKTCKIRKLDTKWGPKIHQNRLTNELFLTSARQLKDE